MTPRPRYAALLLAILAAACLDDSLGPSAFSVAFVGGSADTVWTGAPGEALPGGVRLRISDGEHPLRGATLTWETVGQGSRLANAAAFSNANGEASAVWLLGTNAAEEQTLHVTVRLERKQADLMLRARVVPYVVSGLRVVDTGAVLRVGDTLHLNVAAIDPYGNVFPAPDVAASLDDSTLGSSAGALVVGGPRRGRAIVRVTSHGVGATLPLHVTQFVAAIVPGRDTLVFSSLGAEWPVSYVVRDDRGRVVADTTAALSVSDTTIIRFNGPRLQSVAPGNAALHLQLSPVAASLPTIVDQRIATLRLVRDTIRFDALRDTTTIRPIARDSLGFYVRQPAVVFEVENEQVAELADVALLKAITPGVTLITVLDPETGIYTSVPVVVHQLVRDIDVPSVAFDALGDTVVPAIMPLDRLGSPVAAAQLEYTVSDTSVVKVGADGKLHSVAPGQVQLTVRDQETGTFTTSNIVVQQRIITLALDVDTLAFDALRDTVHVTLVGRDRLGAIVADAAGRTTYASTDPSVIDVSPGGAVASTGNGSALVIAQSSDGPADTVRVDVAQRVASVVVDRDSVRFESLRAEAPVSATAFDRRGVPVAAALEYAVEDTAVAQVAGAGRLIAVRNGTTQVTATAGGVVTSIPVVVRQVVRTIEASPVLFDALGDIVTAAITPRDGLGSPVVDATLTYSVSDSGVVGVKPGGRLQSRSPGQVTLSVRDDETGTTVNTDVTVHQRITSLALDIDTLSFDALLDTSQVAVVAHDRLGALVADAAGRTSYLSTDPGVAAVSPSGAVHSSGNGSALVIAQSTDGPADTVQVDVAQRVTSLAVDRDSVLFEALHAEVPILGAALDRRGVAVASAPVLYSMEDTTIARVGVGGLVQALNNGITRVIATAGGIDVPIRIRVAQRPVRVAMARDTIRFDALGDTQTVTGIAVDSLGSPVGGTITSIVVADPGIAVTLDSITLRAQGNGITQATVAAAGVTGQVIVAVQQSATTLTAAVTFDKQIVTLPVGAVLPITCQALDRNGFAVDQEPSLVEAVAGTVSGATCGDVRIQRSGFDTLVFTLGAASTRVPVIVAASPVVSLPLGEFAIADTLPGQPGNTWAPSAHRNARGELEVYYTVWSGVRDSSGFTRGDLHRLVWLGGNQFRYDGIAIKHDDNICSPQGQGIENVVIAPRADSIGFRMFYAAGSNKCYGWQVFSAVSTDGRTWTKESGIRLSNGGSGVSWPPWPVGEGMVVDRLPSGEWRMVVASFEHITPPETTRWQITEWRSTDQLEWTYVGTVLTTRDMPEGWQGSVYSPTVREIRPGLWRMLFTATDRASPGGRDAVWSAVSTDRAHWQVEREVLGGVSSNLFYATLIDDQVVFIRQDNGGPMHLSIATVSMP